MPRVSTVSTRTTDLCGPVSPIPARVRFCWSERPTPLFTWVIFNLSAIRTYLLSLRRAAAEHLGDRLAARLRHLVERAERLERHDRRVDDVVVVRRADRLGEDVG